MMVKEESKKYSYVFYWQNYSLLVTSFTFYYSYKQLSRKPRFVTFHLIPIQFTVLKKEIDQGTQIMVIDSCFTYYELYIQRELQHPSHFQLVFKTTFLLLHSSDCASDSQAIQHVGEWHSPEIQNCSICRAISFGSLNSHTIYITRISHGNTVLLPFVKCLLCNLY